MNHLIVGYGEIGKAVHDVAVVGKTGMIDLGIEEDVPSNVDVLHVCFPYSEDFNKEVEKYIKVHSPEHIIVWSTVPIGTCANIDVRVVHSPVEGVHPELEMSLRQMERWIGYNQKSEGQFFANYFQDLGLRTKLVPSTHFTEALKLLSTTEYGINIEFARYKKRVADEIGMDYELCKEFNQEYNRLYRNLGMDKRFQKFVLDAPEGKKGGHCVTSNSRILHDQFPSELTKIVGEL